VVDATHPARPDDHAAHDLLLVAEAADRTGRLPATLAACPDCRALHAELIAIGAALPTAALPTRPRAYTLTPADAARLRPPIWRRWLAAVGTSRDAVTRPLALGFTTIGLAGLLVATVPGALTMGGSTAGAAPGGHESLQLGAPSAGPGDVAGDNGQGATQGGADGPVASTPDAPERTAAAADEGAGISLLLTLSVALLVAGMGLFAVRRLAPRGTAGR
jgi:hypothetical protein